VLAPGKPFQPSLLSVGKAKSLPKVEHIKRSFARVSSCLIRKNCVILEKLLRDECSSSLQKFVTYSRKRFYKIGPRPLVSTKRRVRVNQHTHFPLTPTYLLLLSAFRKSTSAPIMTLSGSYASVLLARGE